MMTSSEDHETALSRRLDHFVALAPADKDALRASALGPIREVHARYDLIREGDAPRAVFLIVSGWAARYKTLEDGRRQLVAFLIPGDLCDLNNSLLREMDHSIGAMTTVRYVEVTNETLDELARARPSISRALWLQLLATLSIQREWALNLGQRDAMERISHLFCELFFRMRAVGLTAGNRVELPITQQDIADATGLTSVHVNRITKEMRAQGLIALHRRVLEIADLDRLKETALFNPAYLHFQRDAERSGARPGIGVVAA